MHKVVVVKFVLSSLMMLIELLLRLMDTFFSIRHQLVSGLVLLGAVELLALLALGVSILLVSIL
jgi:hypothetical protein